MIEIILVNNLDAMQKKGNNNFLLKTKPLKHIQVLSL
jgi:hypothetical protein